MSVTVIGDAEQQLKILSDLAELGDPRLVTTALLVGGNKLKSIVSEYPPVNRRPQPFKSVKQRKYFFWALKQGIIQVPYVRGHSPGSEDMKHRWIVRQTGEGVEVANNTSYVHLVHDAKEQAAYHREGGWQTDEDVMKNHGEAVINDVTTAYMMAVKHIWEG